MTTRHILEGIMQWTGARSHNRCSVIIGIDRATVHRMGKISTTSMRIETMDQIQRKTDIPLDTLFAWYRMPEGAPLGRITKEKPRDG